MRDENRKCPRCGSREIKKTEKQEHFVIEDWPHNYTFEVLYFLCEECDLIFGERIW